MLTLNEKIEELNDNLEIALMKIRNLELRDQLHTKNQALTLKALECIQDLLEDR